MSLSLVKYFTYLLLIQKSLAEININITLASTKGAAKLICTGSDLKLVTQKEIKLYNITDRNLKISVKEDFGKEPDEVFLKDPTYYGYVYYKYHWNQIHRKVEVKAAEIEDIVNKEVVLTVRNHINNTTRKTKVKIDLYETVETTISSFWDKDAFEDNIYYNINTFYFKTELSFNNTWKDNNFKSLTSIIGSKSVGFVDIEPGRTVTTTLAAKSTILLVKIVYASSLIGNLVANYARLFGKYHIWAPPISEVMKFGNLTNEIIVNELIEIKCYTDPVIYVIDKETGKKVPLMFDNKPFHKRKQKKLNLN